VKKRQPTDILLYKWRYVIGYTLLAMLYIGAGIVSAIYTPGGLTQQEIDAIQPTNDLSLSLRSLATVNLPFHLLQLASFKLLGVTILSVKLPSIILYVISSIAIFLLLRRWFKPNVVILSMLIMATTAQLLFIGQSATSGILYVFYTALLLLFATMVVQKERGAILWKICLAITAGLSLFTPYFWYINLGLLVIAILHPHPRHFLIKRKYLASWTIPVLIFAGITAIIAYACLISPDFLHSILGVKYITLDIVSNLKTLYRLYLRPEPLVIDGQITPIIDFGATLLIIFGLLNSVKRITAARTFMTWSWLILSMALLLVQPQLTTVIIIPLFILLAIGIESLLHEWYKLFPKNPYARGTGLVLTSILVLTMTIGGSVRYIDGYRYYPEAAKQFNKDITLLIQHVKPNTAATILVAPSEKPLYTALAKHSSHITVTTSAPESIKTPLYVTQAAHSSLQKNSAISLSAVITNDQAEAGDRFYTYTPTEK